MNIVDNKKEQRFEAKINGKLALIEYTVKPGILSLNHTEVPKELSGQGIASEMTEKVLLQIEQRGLKVIPACPYTKKYIDKHPEWKSILVK